MSLQSEPAGRTASGQDGWYLKLPVTPLRLEDERLLDYRHPAEHPLLALSLLVLAILVALAVVLGRRPILLGLVGIWLSMVLTSLQAATYNMLRGAEVTPIQFATIYQIVQELCQRFQMPPPRVFVIRKRNVQAETFGFMAPYVIVLPSLLLDTVNEQELRYVIGQQLGHIRFGHTRMAILLGGDESTLPAVLSWVAQLRDLIFAGYWRAEVMTGDRAGILACGNVRTAIRAQTKFAVGPNQAREVREEALIEQAYKLTQGMSRLQARLIHLQSTTPPLIPRLEAMVKWAGLPPQEEGS